MHNKIVQKYTQSVRRQLGIDVLAHLRCAAFLLVFCAAVCPASAVQQREPVVRRDTPFPVVFGPSSAGTTVEPIRYEVLRGDFHMHTPHSDGKIAPVDRVIEAWQHGYDVIAITDHRNFHAYAEALPMAETLGVLLMRGMETGLGGKEHLVALDFSADYQPRNPHQWADAEGQAQVFYQEQWQRLSDAGGYVLYAHPHVGLRETMLWGIRDGLLRGIEVKNDVVGSGWNTVESHGTHWYPFALDWAVEHNLAVFANSDVHGPRGDAEQAVTLVLARDRSREAVREALDAGRTVACFNGMLCAHRSVLEVLMASLVDVSIEEMGDERIFLRLHNRGPVELAAEIAGVPVDPVALGTYEKVLIGLRRKPDVVTVTWKNLWTRSTENLTTTHRFVAAGM